MGLIKKCLLILVLTLVFVVAFLAAIDNSTEVALKFMGFTTPVLPVSWWILLAFVLGTLFGVLLNVFSNARLKLSARVANRAAASRTQPVTPSKPS